MPEDGQNGKSQESELQLCLIAGRLCCAIPGFLWSCVYAGAEGAAETMSHWRICPYALAFSRVKTAANPTVVDRKYTSSLE